MSILPIIGFTSRDDFKRMPKLQLLGQWANDYIIGVATGFGVPAPGYAVKPEKQAELRATFLRRLDDYAKMLPWNLKWLLLQRTNDNGDDDLRLSIVDAFLRFDPIDTHFQIASAHALARICRSQ